MRLASVSATLYAPGSVVSVPVTMRLCGGS